MQWAPGTIWHVSTARPRQPCGHCRHAVQWEDLAATASDATQLAAGTSAPLVAALEETRAAQQGRDCSSRAPLGAVSMPRPLFCGERTSTSPKALQRRRCVLCTVTTYGSSKKQRHAHHAAKKHSPILTSRVAQAHKAPVRVTMLDALSLHDLMHSPFVVPAQVSGGARVQHSGKSYEQRDGVVQSMVAQQMVRNMS